MTSSAPVVVIGAGISGLVCAYALRKQGIGVRVVEASANAGGMICSPRREGFLLELGPQSFSGTASVRGLCGELGIAGQIVEAPARAPRYVLVDGKLQAVPLSPPALLASSLLSPQTKWRIVRDALGTSKPTQEDESVAVFIRRKFGDQLLERLVGPFVSGIYAGDPERLSLRSAFPQLHHAEKSAGSIIRGMLRAAKSNKAPRERSSLLSFRAGNQTLVHALAEKLGSDLSLQAEVLAINRGRESGGAAFELRILDRGGERIAAAKHLILAVPADVAGALLRDVHAAFEPILGGTEYAPLAVVSLGYRREDVEHPLNGFGFLAPRSSGLRVLGSVWNSSLFPERAPASHVLLTSFVGGATDSGIAVLPEQELTTLVHREIAPLLQIRAAPVFSHAQIYRRALPQYNVGHGERLHALEQLRGQFPGLSFVGNYLRGPAIGNCVEAAQAVAGEIATHSDASEQAALSADRV